MSNEPIKLPVHPLINPLNDDDRQAIEGVLARHPEIADLLERAEQCGVDLGPRKDVHAMHHTVATRMHTLFFPKQLPAIQE